jgi:hypothetical protein
VSGADSPVGTNRTRTRSMKKTKLLTGALSALILVGTGIPAGALPG